MCWLSMARQYCLSVLNTLSHTQSWVLTMQTNLSDSIDSLYEGDIEKGVSTGWATVDPYYLVRPGAFTVVTGIPSSGKSNWLDAMMVNVAKNHGWNFGIFSPENQPLEDHMARVLEKYVGHPFFDGPTPCMSREELEDGKRWLTKHFTWILPDDDKEVVY